MKFSLPINKNIASTLRAWRSEFVGGALLSVSDFFFKDFDPSTDFNGMTVTNYAVNRARYFRLWKFCWFSIDIAATLSAPLTTSYTITMPVTAAGDISHLQGGAGFNDNASVSEVCIWQIGGGTRLLTIYRSPASSAFTAGGTRARINGFIEID